MVKTLFYLLFSIFICFIATVWGTDLSLSASLDKTDIKFEETVELTIEVKWTGDLTDFRFQVFMLPEADRLKVLGTQSKISSGEEDGQEVTTRLYKYTFKPLSAGKGTIFPITLNYVAMPDSIPGELSSPELSVIIAEPVVVEKKNDSDFGWIYLIVAVVVIVSGIFVIIKTRKNQKHEPTKTPIEVLLDGLKEARKESGTDRKIFFTCLYKLLLQYMENTYGRDMQGMTLDTIIENIEKSDIPENEKANLVKWLKMAEKEKFAPGTGSPGETLRLAAEIENYFNNISSRA